MLESWKIVLLEVVSGGFKKPSSSFQEEFSAVPERFRNSRFKTFLEPGMKGGRSVGFLNWTPIVLKSFQKRFSDVLKSRESGEF